MIERKKSVSSLSKIEAELERQKRITELEVQILAERRMRDNYKKKFPWQDEKEHE